MLGKFFDREGIRERATLFLVEGVDDGYFFSQEVGHKGPQRIELGCPHVECPDLSGPPHSRAKLSRSYC